MEQTQPTNGAAPAALIDPAAIKLPPAEDPADSFTYLPLSEPHASPTNPRKTFDPKKLKELAQSFRSQGILSPILVRRSPWEPGRFEIIDGERRYRAAKLTRTMLDVPARIVHMTDAAVLEAQVVANAQREDVPELEEAEGYKLLMGAAELTVDQIAQKVGKSRETVYARLKLLDGIPEVRAALAAGKITAGHAILIVRFQPKEQKRALDYCTPKHRDDAISVRSLDEWLDYEVRLNLDQAPFSDTDQKLVPAAGACANCEKRDKKRCFDPSCFHAKARAHVAAAREKLAKRGEFVEIVTAYGGGKAPKGAIERGRWNEVPAGQTGANVKTALVVDGKDAGKIIHVKVSAPRKPEPKRDWEAEGREREAKQRREVAVRERILDAILEKVKAPLDRADLELIAFGLIDDRQADTVARRHGLAVKESYDPKFEQKIRGMISGLKPQPFAHLLIELALSHELEGYSPEAESLLALARRYKVNAEKIRADAEREWKPQTSAKPKTAAAGGAK